MTNALKFPIGTAGLVEVKILTWSESFSWHFCLGQEGRFLLCLVEYFQAGNFGRFDFEILNSYQVDLTYDPVRFLTYP